MTADYRLAFRELGLSIRLGVVERLPGLVEGNERTFDKEHRLEARIKTLTKHGPLKEAAEGF